jgi:hypothetical protein
MRVGSRQRITVTGDGSTGAGGAILTIRLTGRGVLDSSFGRAGTGRVVMDAPTGGSDPTCGAAPSASGGLSVGVGAMLAQLRQNGTPNGRFAPRGFLTIRNPARVTINAVARSGRQRVVVAGAAGSAFYVARYRLPRRSRRPCGRRPTLCTIDSGRRFCVPDRCESATGLGRLGAPRRLASGITPLSAERVGGPSAARPAPPASPAADHVIGAHSLPQIRCTAAESTRSAPERPATPRPDGPSDRPRRSHSRTGTGLQASSANASEAARDRDEVAEHALARELEPGSGAHDGDLPDRRRPADHGVVRPVDARERVVAG